MKKIIEEYQDIILEVISAALFFVLILIVINCVCEMNCNNHEFLL